MVNVVVIQFASLFATISVSIQANVSSYTTTKTYESKNSFHPHRRRTRPRVLQELARSSLDNAGRGRYVDYSGRHPFELYEASIGKVGSASTNDTREDNKGRQNIGGGKRQTNTITTGDGKVIPPEYEPMRVYFDDSQLQRELLGRNEPSSIDYDKTSAKIRAIRDNVLPAVADVWSSHLSVIRAAAPLLIPKEACFGLYHIPETYATHGVEDADLLVLVSAWDYLPGGGQRLCMGDEVLAGAAACELDQHDRPFVGLVNFCLGAMDIDEATGTVTSAVVDQFLDVAVHEIAHLLGANSYMFKYFRDPKSGEPLTPRPFEVTERYMCVDGIVRKNVVVPSCSTLQRGRSSTGSDIFEIVTPTVVQVVRNQFGCQTLSGARLENQPTSSDDCFGTHWDERYYFSELMSGIYHSGTGYLSPLTLALLEDSGWYRAVFEKAEVSPFGHLAGCEFVEGNCVENGRIPAYSEGFFCNQVRNQAFPSLDAVVCDPSHTHKAKCDLFHGQYPPFDHRYTPALTAGPRFIHADWCPVAGDDTIDCRDEKASEGGMSIIIPEEKYSSDSRCFRSNVQGREQSLCLSSRCNLKDRVLEINIGDYLYVCNSDFDTISFQSEVGNVKVQCPRLSAICPNMFCPANCSGKGKCDVSLPTPKCVCFDDGDDTPGCFNSDPQSGKEHGACSSGFSKHKLKTTAALVTSICLIHLT